MASSVWSPDPVVLIANVPPVPVTLTAGSWWEEMAGIGKILARVEP